jgi:predicted O-methyltransferase YrrM
MYGYDLARLPNRHLATLEEGVGTIEQARQRSGASIGYPGWGLIYHLMLAHLDRKRYEVVVETGTNWGCTTIVLAQALADAKCEGHVVTFELDEDNAEIARSNISAAGLSDRVKLHVGDSHKLLQAALRGDATVRVAFLDASHLFYDVLYEFEAIFPRLADDALVIFDNTYQIAEEHEDQRVNGALKAIVQRHGGNLINLEFVSWYTPGLALWQRRPIL